MHRGDLFQSAATVVRIDAVMYLLRPSVAGISAQAPVPCLAQSNQLY